MSNNNMKRTKIQQLNAMGDLLGQKNTGTWGVNTTVAIMIHPRLSPQSEKSGQLNHLPGGGGGIQTHYF